MQMLDSMEGREGGRRECTPVGWRDAAKIKQHGESQHETSALANTPLTAPSAFTLAARPCRQRAALYRLRKQAALAQSAALPA